jgi:DNA-binding PadR family transcriptional regulator
MIRFHYGPWDDRYYHVLAFLESTGLLEVTKVKNAFILALTDKGKFAAKQLADEPEYSTLVEQMKRVKKVLGSRAGSSLKKLIYTVFEKEVGQRNLGETIE